MATPALIFKKGDCVTFPMLKPAGAVREAEVQAVRGIVESASVLTNAKYPLGDTILEVWVNGTAMDVNAAEVTLVYRQGAIVRNGHICEELAVAE